MADPAHALAIMSMIQSMGVRLSIDDFGTGYSSLTHLRQLPIDEIKVDKSFVTGMTTSDADAAIVRTVIDLAHNLGKQVCAEGVEDEEEPSVRVVHARVHGTPTFPGTPRSLPSTTTCTVAPVSIRIARSCSAVNERVSPALMRKLCGIPSTVTVTSTF